MKGVIILLLTMCIYSHLSSQNYHNQRYDRQKYFTSYGGNRCLNNDPTDTVYTRGVLMDFQGNDLQMFPIDTFEQGVLPKLSAFNMSTQISDPTGRFLAHFNGRYLTDRYFDQTELTIFKKSDYIIQYIVGSAILLPMPGYDDDYIIIGLNDFKYDNHQKVDMANDISTVRFYASDEGRLTITEQVVSHLKSEYSFHGSMTACRHANGRDWWIIAPHRTKNLFHYFILRPDGLHFSHDQEVDVDILRDVYMANFSPKGSFYTRVHFHSKSMYEKINYGQIFPFDRCRGLLGESINITFPYEDSASILQIHFEPNERYFYANCGTTLWQGDIEADDVEGSLMRVGRYDPTIIDNFKFVTISFSFLAPDGKIYIMDGNNRFRVSIIHNPSERGEACHFEYAAISRPSCSMMFEVVPHFGLGPVDGSPCDTLGLDAPLSRGQVTTPRETLYYTYPNPSTGLMKIHTTEGFTGTVRVYDMLGRKLKDVVYEPSLEVNLGSYHGMVMVQWCNARGETVHVDKHLVIGGR